MTGNRTKVFTTTAHSPHPKPPNRPEKELHNHRLSRVRSLKIERKCEECGCTFTARTSVTRFCSSKCTQRNYYKRNKKDKKERVSKQQAKRVSPQRDPNFLTVQEFADRIGVCKQTVHNMNSRGQVRIIRFTKRLSLIYWPDFIASFHPSTDNPPSESEAAVKIPTNFSNCPEVPISNHLYTNGGHTPQQTPTEKASGWLDANSASQRYGLTIKSFYVYVSKNKVAKKIEKNKVLYSQTDLDSKRNFIEGSTGREYTGKYQKQVLP